jgi:hypothetical protein
MAGSNFEITEAWILFLTGKATYTHSSRVVSTAIVAQ